MNKFIFALLIILPSMIFANFHIEFDERWDEISGTINGQEFDLEINSSWNEIEGEMFGREVKIEFDTIWNEVEGFLPCGSVQIKLDKFDKEVKASICGNSFSGPIKNIQQGRKLAFRLIMDELLWPFDRFYRKQAVTFIRKRINW